MNYALILDEILKHDIITVFRHCRPDGDAVGSQLGLVTFLKDNFPNKAIYICGLETFDKYPMIDSVSEEIISNSLAIILDTSNRERIDDTRALNAKMTIKIDHHPIVDQFAELNFVNTAAGATCEILTDILTSDVFNEYHLSKEAAAYLYSGLLTDTLCFKTSSTTANTLLVASKLASCGIDIYAINAHIFGKTRRIFDYISYLRSKVEYRDGLAYVILNKEELEEAGVVASEARNYISEFSGIDEFKIWIILTENEKGLYDGSIRSKKEYIINDIAAKYHGGGHANASGIKELTKADIELVINDLIARIKA